MSTGFSNLCLEDDAPLGHGVGTLVTSAPGSSAAKASPLLGDILQESRTFFRVQEQSMSKLTFLGETSVQSVDFFGQVFMCVKEFADTSAAVVAVSPTETILIVA